MQLAAAKIDPMKREDGTGIMGRVRDLLSQQGLSVGAFSLDSNSISLIGKPGETATPMILSNGGVVQFNENPSDDGMDAAIASLNGEVEAHTGAFGDWYSETLLKSLAHNKLLYDTLVDKETEVTFPNSHLGRQLQMVAKMIDSRNERGTDADVFFISKGGWDTHSQVLMNQVNLFADVDASFKAFADEMKAKNVWNNVVLVETSDFARTLTPNGGAGTDHAWGGHYMMMGGSVKGKQIVGEYPESIAEGSALNIGRGRIIPTRSWESVFLPLAQWAGVGNETATLDYVCPNRENFDDANIPEMTELFLEVTLSPSSPPTKGPSASPTTLEPSKSPTGSPIEATDQPTKGPSASPTSGPTPSPNHPTDSPTANPSKGPSTSPTELITGSPTSQPTANPSELITGSPTKSPIHPTNSPSTAPTGSPVEPTTSSPTDGPSQSPQIATPPPTSPPTAGPTANPTTLKPSKSPTGSPVEATDKPTASPSKTPTRAPTGSPSNPPVV
jgi:hypothetical protein